MSNNTINIPPSKNHPNSNNIPLKDVPQFITLQFDDNGIADSENSGAATWIYNYLKDKKNSIGNSNKSTFDDTPIRGTFYLTAKYSREEVYEDNKNVIDIWRKLEQSGNEIGNHSTEHLMRWDYETESCINYNGRDYSVEDWLNKEILPCQKELTDKLALQKRDIKGWRTPRLEWNNNLFIALEKENFLYDCSVESLVDSDGKNEYWPFTLNNGHPDYPEIDNYNGLWEMPAYRFIIPPNIRDKVNGAKAVTGLDYTVWGQKAWGELELSDIDMTDILKHTLDQRILGNRAPMLIGLHSDLYTDLHGKSEELPKTKSAKNRQKAIEDFIDYAIGKYGDTVRFVPVTNIIDWIKNPSPLLNTNNKGD